jgi:hypothetical protein
VEDEAVMLKSVEQSVKGIKFAHRKTSAHKKEARLFAVRVLIKRGD